MTDSAIHMGVSQYVNFHEIEMRPFSSPVLAIYYSKSFCFFLKTLVKERKLCYHIEAEHVWCAKASDA